MTQKPGDKPPGFFHGLLSFTCLTIYLQYNIEKALIIVQIWVII